VVSVDANKIAVKHRLGSRQAPIVNTAILGAFSKLSGIIGIEAIEEAIRESVPVKPEENAKATHEAFEIVMMNQFVDFMEQP